MRENVTNVTSLRDMVAILSGLAIGNSVLVLVTRKSFDNVVAPWNLSAGMLDILFFLAMVFNVLRFFHGNMQVLQCKIDEAKREGHSGIEIAFFVIFIESVLLAVLSFYIVKPYEFVIIFSSILAVDILWAVLALTDNNEAGGADHSDLSAALVSAAKIKWMKINCVTMFFLLPVILLWSKIEALSITLNSNSSAFFAVLIISFSIVADYWLNWGFYFGKED